MSMTYFPLKKATYSILYGCDAEMKQAVLGRLHNSEGAACHPLLLIGIFTEFERTRQIELVEDGFDTLHRTKFSLRRPANNWKEIWNGDSSITQVLNPWLNIHHVKNALESWKEQLTKIIAHIDELSETWFCFVASDPEDERARRCQVREAGERIRERILEIICDYDGRIRECVMIMEGMNLATQLAHARANIEIAASAKTDSNQMRSIALLTMVFLPATFVASVFSMTFFDWDPPESKNVVSSQIWIYFTIAAALTLVVMGLWLMVIRRERREKTLPAIV